MNKTLLLLLALFVAPMARAQNSWVFFHDKGSNCHIDSSVYQPYIEELKTNGYKVLGASRWLNAVAVEGRLTGPLPYPSVKQVRWMPSYRVNTATAGQSVTADSFLYGKTDIAIKMLNLDQYHKMGYTGKGVVLALFDVGFHNVDTLAPFDSLWMNNRVKAWRDFVDKDTNVFDNGGHGTAVLSIAGGNYPDSLTGAAPEVTFVLARTEDVNSETHQEELNWVKAMEWADSIGVDIIHSSLGYSDFDTLEGDYTYFDMDGETTIITLAANIATSKGIFVTNSAGNEGAKPWKYITAPCDGKDVLCVGAVDSFRVKADFSSFGPSADGRVKPEVMAMGKNIHYIDATGRVLSGNGTSLSGPLIAGMVACLKQAWPGVSNDTLFDVIIRSADRYSQPDSAYGYGIPDVLVADSLLRTMVSIKETSGPVALKIFPNPASDYLVVESDQTMVQIRLFDLATGRVILYRMPSTSTTEMNLRSVSPGLYGVEIQTIEGTYMQRIVVSPN